jgi:Tfp pilus assembly protein FimT
VLPPPLRTHSAFTLLELLVVVGIVTLLVVLAIPAFTTRKSADEVTNAAYTIAGVLEQARNYALSNNTYVWVGFYEENSTATSPTNATPPYPGKGRLVVAAISSVDGTKIFDDADPPTFLPAVRIKQLGRLTRVEGIHMTEIGAPPSPTPFSPPDPNGIDGRPAQPYADGSPFDHYNRISSDDPGTKQVNGDRTQFPFVAQSYTFYKTVRFSPRGEANINSTYSLKHAAEIGLISTHGNSAPTPPTSPARYSGNVVALQFNGIGGNIKIYRK